MAKLIYEDKDFKVLKGHDFIVVRKNHPYKFHSHFYTIGGAMELIKLFRMKKQPVEEYFSTAMKRITTSEEFESFSLQRKRQLYFNLNKGVS